MGRPIKIISGGQTGADMAGLVAGQKLGVPTGGYAPKDWNTEIGPAPWLAQYGLVEHPHRGYQARTIKNAAISDLTFWFGYIGSPGGKLTKMCCNGLIKPIHQVDAPFEDMDDAIAYLYRELMLDKGARVLNIAGNRESSRPGMQDYVVELLVKLWEKFDE